MRLTTSLLLTGLLLAGCSDDTKGKTDTGTKLDQKSNPVEKGVGDVALKTEGNTDGKVTCTTPTQKVVTYAPKPGSTGVGWDDDAAKWGATGPGPHAAYTDTDIEALPIDGHNQPFEGKNNGFVMEYYKKGDEVLTFYLWDMKSTTLAQQVYTTEKTTDETAAKISFEDIPNVPEKSVIGKASGKYWRVWGYKCNYLYEIADACVLVTGTTVCDGTKVDTMKADVIAFVNYFIKLLP